MKGLTLYRLRKTLAERRAAWLVWADVPKPLTGEQKTEAWAAMWAYLAAAAEYGQAAKAARDAKQGKP